MEYFCDHLTLRLRGVEKVFYKNIIFSLRSLLMVMGAIFLISGPPVLKVIGFWLVIIFAFYFLKNRQRSNQDVRFGQSANLVDYLTVEAVGYIFDGLKDLENAKLEQIQLTLLSKLIQAQDTRRMLALLGCSVSFLQKEIAANLSLEKRLPELDLQGTRPLLIREALVGAVAKATALARLVNFTSVTPAGLTVALSSIGDFYTKAVFSKLRLRPDFLLAALVLSQFGRKQHATSLNDFLEIPLPQRCYTQRLRTLPSGRLYQCGLDLTELALAGKIGFLIGHRREVDEIISILEKKESCQLLLVGEAGVGKKTLVQHLAWRFCFDQTPANFFDYRLFKIESQPPAVISDSINATLVACLNEAAQTAKLILCLVDLDYYWADDLPTLELAKQNVIVTMSEPDKIKKFQQRNKNFQTIQVQPLSAEEDLTRLSFEAVLLQQQENIKITPQAVAALMSLSVNLNQAKALLRRSFSLACQQELRLINEELVADLTVR